MLFSLFNLLFQMVAQLTYTDKTRCIIARYSNVVCVCVTTHWTL